MQSTVLFLCPHSAAKSVMAAAYFNQRATQAGLAWTALFAGTEPAEKLSPAVVQLLHNAGMDVSQQQPCLVTHDDLATADRVVSLGCAVEELALTPARFEEWNDVPMPSQDLHGAQEAIRNQVEQLLTELQATR